MRPLCLLPAVLAAATLLIPAVGCTAAQKRVTPTRCWAELAAGMPQQNTSVAFVFSSVDSGGTDRPWIAWYYGVRGNVRRWTGRAWEEIPSPSDTEAAVLRVAPDGTAVMAWMEVLGAQSSGIAVARWNGEGWRRLGAPLNAHTRGEPKAGGPTMALDEDGRPIVAWLESTRAGSGGLYAVRWDGAQWQRMGEPLSVGYAAEPTLALDSSGKPWVAWATGTRARAFIRVARWSGSGWVDVGESASGTLCRRMNARMPQLVLPENDEALLVWLETGKGTGALESARWTGRAWHPRPTPSSVRSPWAPSLILGSEGTPLLAWSELDEISTFSVQRLAADGWQPVLTRMHLDPGQSDVDRVSLSRGPGRTFYALWDEPGDDGRRTRVIRIWPCGKGEKPEAPPPLRPLDSFWPKSVEAAVEQLVATLDEESKAEVRSTSEDDLIQFHHGWGTGIRNSFGLWRGNTALLESCGAKDIHPDRCSMIIIERVWQRLQDTPPDPKK